MCMVLCFALLKANNNPVELGNVEWLRNYDEAIKLSKQVDKPILILFQEVPGCHTCTTYGKNVLSHPLLVEIIEDFFVPLAIFNNKGGHDKEVLKKYGEPTWNNPVVRIVNKEGVNIINRINGVYTEKALLEGMLSALEQSNMVIPTWMKLLKQELDPGKPLKKATFSMGCFWTGETYIGEIDGVITSRAGWMSGHEVVAVEYDPSIVSFERLSKTAAKKGVANKAFTDNTSEEKIAKVTIGKVQGLERFQDDRQPKYHTLNSYYKYLPMMEVQATKVNAALGKRQDPSQYLSPRQIELHKTISAKKGKGYDVVIQKDFLESMKKVGV